jgi:hypothetical protein
MVKKLKSELGTLIELGVALQGGKEELPQGFFTSGIRRP